MARRVLRLAWAGWAATAAALVLAVWIPVAVSQPTFSATTALAAYKTALGVVSEVTPATPLPVSAVDPATTFSCFIEAATVTAACTNIAGSGLRNYVTSIQLVNQAATAQTLDVVYGTGATCQTGTTALTPKFSFVAAAAVVNYSASLRNPLVPGLANRVCVRPSAATAFGAVLTGYTAP